MFIQDALFIRRAHHEDHTAGGYLFDKLMEYLDVLMTTGAPIIEVNGNVGVNLNVCERHGKNALYK